MSRKIRWEVLQDGRHAFEPEIVAPTRTAALAIAEAKWMADTRDWRHPLTDDDGTVYPAVQMPQFTVRKVA